MGLNQAPKGSPKFFISKAEILTQKCQPDLICHEPLIGTISDLLRLIFSPDTTSKHKRTRFK